MNSRAQTLVEHTCTKPLLNISYFAGDIILVHPVIVVEPDGWV